MLAQTKKGAAKYFDEQSAIYFDKNYRRIDEKYPVLCLRHNYILSMIDGHMGGALDVGCGSGAMLIDLSKRGYETVGVDISPAMVRTATEFSLRSGLAETFMSVADIENLPFADKSFDLVICAGVVEYLDQDDRALNEISRVLKSNGTAFISVTNALTPFWFFETVAKVIGVWSKLLFLVKGGTSFPKARVHVPYSLINRALKVGLVEVDRAYFHFSPFPFPLNVIFPNLCKSVGMRMENLSKSKLGFIGRGCILKFMKCLKK